MRTFISVSEAREIVLGRCGLMETETVRLDEAVGRILAEAVRSPDSIPPFDNSAMDGYAVRAADLGDLPATLRVIEDIPAGTVPRKTVETGCCSRIMTGAPMPGGADTVIPVEQSELLGAGGEMVRFGRGVTRGQHVRKAAEDIRAGQQVFEPGRRVTPPVVGMLAALGVSDVVVRRRPTVSIIATGDELVDVSQRPAAGQIRNSNGPALAAQATHAGARVEHVLLARDAPEEIERAISRALESDVAILSGGVSVGEHDHVKAALDAVGVELLFWKVRQRPGKPLAFGVRGSRLVFGLPGNPVSSSICFEQYVRPALMRLMGGKETERRRATARLAAPVGKQAGLYFFVRGTATFRAGGSISAQPTGPQGSNLYSSVVSADCLIHLPESMVDPAPGAEVEIEWLDW